MLPPLNKPYLWMVLTKDAKPCKQCKGIPSLYVNPFTRSRRVAFRAWCGDTKCDVAMVSSLLPPGFGGFEDVHATMQSLVEVWNAKQELTVKAPDGRSDD